MIFFYGCGYEQGPALPPRYFWLEMLILYIIPRHIRYFFPYLSSHGSCFVLASGITVCELVWLHGLYIMF
jgi:hypothetical protein